MTNTTRSRYGGPYRSRNGIFFGVCRGLADYFDFSAFWMRVICVVTFFVSGFFPVVVAYIVAALLMRLEPALTLRERPGRGILQQLQRLAPHGAQPAPEHLRQPRQAHPAHREHCHGPRIRLGSAPAQQLVRRRFYDERNTSMATTFPQRVGVLAALASIALLHACAALATEVGTSEVRKVRDGWERTETLRPAFSAEGALSVDNYNGGINVVPSDDGTLSVTVVQKVKPRRSRWFGLRASRLGEAEAVAVLEGMAVAVSGDPARLALKTGRLPKSSGFSGSATYTIHLPRSASAELSTTNGHVVARETGTRIEANSTNGTIVVERVDGPVDARTTNGKIELDAVLGPVDAHTTNGGINVRGLQNHLEATTTNGGITCHYAGVLRAGTDIDCRTSNGGITLVAAPESAFSLHAATTNGRIRSSFPLTETGTRRATRSTRWWARAARTSR